MTVLEDFFLTAGFTRHQAIQIVKAIRWATGGSSPGVFPNSAGPTLHEWLASYDSTTGNFTLTQPAYTDISGTPQLAQSLANASHKWLNSYDATTGLFTQSQPAYSDISGTPTAQTADETSIHLAASVYSLKAFTGDGTTVAGNVAFTLATVNSNVGTFGSATQVAQVTVNGKGLTTAVANVPITGLSASGDVWTWSTQSASFNAAKDNGYYVDTASVVATLPASPSMGHRIRFCIKTSIASFSCGRNSLKIMGTTTDLTFPTYSFPFAFELVYMSAADGWVIIST
jgi:hypothetical protein